MTTMTTGSGSVPRPVVRVTGEHAATEDDVLAVEEPLEIRLDQKPLAITMRTPGDDLDLAAGFCFTEGLFHHVAELLDVRHCPTTDQRNVVLVTLAQEALAARERQIERARRELYMSSSCGLCGKQTLDRIETIAPPIRGKFTIPRAILHGLPGVMRRSQATFERTGGLHAAALFTPAGTLRVLREDVGRHNAVDKVIGHGVLTEAVPLDPAVLLVSGRASFEIMQKAAMAGIAVVAAVSAPSTLAVDFAVRMKMTLVGFLREGRMNIYHDEGRIQA